MKRSSVRLPAKCADPDDPQARPAAGRGPRRGADADPDDLQARQAAVWAWSRKETERRNRFERPDAVAELEPPDAFSEEYVTRQQLAEIRPDADPEAFGPRSQTVRGLLCGACAGWREPPTSAELYDAMRAENPTDRQLAIAGVLINEASFEELLNASIEGVFTWRQLARRRLGIAWYLHPDAGPSGDGRPETAPEPAPCLGADSGRPGSWAIRAAGGGPRAVPPGG